MITKEEARKIVQDKLAKNLTISSSWETEYDWVFSLSFVDENGEILPIFGGSSVRVSKEDGEMTV